MRIAIVDDQRDIIDTIKEFIEQICTEKALTYQIDAFSDGKELLENYKPVYDVIFLDIEMEDIDGMTAARQIREADSDTILIFVTQMAQYALEGYRVDALDFMVKPIDFFSFNIVFQKVLRNLEKQKGKDLILNVKGVRKVLRTSEIYYVEVTDHYLTYHTINENIRILGTLSDVQEQLSHCGFFKCNRYCLVNLQYISAVNKTDVQVQGDTISLPRPKRQELLLALARYRGGMI